MTIPVALCLSALAAYLLGCVNGAIAASRLFFGEDIRTKGSGNAGLTNFYRVYGVRGVLLLIAIDVLKTVAAVSLGRYILGRCAYPLHGAYWSGLWVILGHSYPCFYRFRGGKGILCAGVLLWFLGWKIALVGFGAFFLGVLISGYISLGSIFAIVSFPIMTAAVYSGVPQFGYIFAVSFLTAASTFWSHRSNVVRLLKGKENKFHLHGKKEKNQ